LHKVYLGYLECIAACYYFFHVKHNCDKRTEGCMGHLLGANPAARLRRTTCLIHTLPPEFLI
jgi:hypothetical protein